MNNTTIKIFQSIEDVANHTANFLTKITNKKLVKNDFYVALAGGSTPKKVFKYLAENYKEKINWGVLNVFFGDERCVSPNDEESNFKMTNNTLFTQIQMDSRNIFRIKGEENPIDEAKRYSEIVQTNLPIKNKRPRFDIILLGLGEDGHTASIFPNQIELFNSQNICEVATHPTSKQKRISITGSIINNASLVVFIVTGKNKAKIVSKILGKENNKYNFPASLVNPLQGKLVWLLDKEAAQELDNKILQLSKRYYTP